MQTQTRNRKLFRRGLTVAGLRRCPVYQPLATLLAILMLPVISWMEGAGAGLFQAQAQIGGCLATGNSIIQNYCVNGIVYAADLVQFENDAVGSYLKLHSLPDTDAQLIYSYGREDLRNEIRGLMMDILRAIIAEPAAKRSTHEQSLYNWLQALIQRNEIMEYTKALDHFNSFQSNPCKFTLDPDLASQFKLSYDGTPFCYAGTQSAIFSPPIPAASYFIAYGLKQSYQLPASTHPYFPGLVAGTTIAENKALADFAVLGGSLATVSIVPVIQIVIQWAYLAYAIALTTAESLQALDVLVALAPVVNIIGTGATYLGPLGIILDCVIAGVVAALEIYNNELVLATLNDLRNTLAKVQTTPPDLTAFVTDSVNLTKLRMTLVSQTVPDKPSAAALPAHNSSDLNFAISPAVGGSVQVTDKLFYEDWRGASWMAQTYGGWFVQSCSDGTTKCSQKDSLIASIKYVDWNGVDWIASRSGDRFVSTKADPASTDVLCAPDTLTGVTPATTVVTNCSSYVSRSIPVSNGTNRMVVSLSTLAPPVFTSPSYLAFGPSIPSTQTITASGNPLPSVCVTSSDLPANFTLNGGAACGNGSFKLEFNGAPDVPQGLYTLALKASGSAGSISQNFTINVSPQLGIISPNTLNGTAGFPVTFTVKATGTPPIKLSVDPLLPLAGLTFKDNGDSTGTISGIYTTPFNFTCEKISPPGPCGIIAENSQGTYEQQFQINMIPAPTASIVAPLSATFHDGVFNQVLLSSTGAITPVSWNFFTPPTPPAWLRLKDNGNGTAVLSGTPPLGTSGTFTFEVIPSAFASVSFAATYTITVVNTPVVTSPGIATFTAGTAGSFGILANKGTASLSNTLPKGLSFIPGSSLGCFIAGCVGAILGTPAAGTGGQYNLILTDDAGAAGLATQNLILNVNEAPKITSENTATMFVGVPGMFAVTTTGFPSVSTHAVAANAPPPTDPANGDGMQFTVAGLPATLKASNADSQGFGGGTLTIQGTPSAADVGPHQVQITAQNGVGAPAQQTLKLNILSLTGPSPASSTTCNGNYNGTFKGSITVSAGQNCAFYGGGVTGSITVNGGSLALNNAAVGGSLSIQGPSAFSIGPGATIGGNLAIQSTASGSSTSRICEAAVSGNLQALNNAIPIQIGSTDPFCWGNSVGGNLLVQGNTAAIGVYNNIVGKNLSCLSNASITGGGNSAQKKDGQCSAF